MPLEDFLASTVLSHHIFVLCLLFLKKHSLLPPPKKSEYQFLVCVTLKNGETQLVVLSETHNEGELRKVN